MRISVLGGGAWGTALASMLADNKGDVVLWARNEETVKVINERHQNPNYLGEIALSEKLKATTDLTEACEADILLCVTPAQSFANLASEIKPLLESNTTLVLCAKGIDRQSGNLLHTLAAERCGTENIAALSGPSFAADVAKGLPTALSLSAPTLEMAHTLAAELSSPRFRIYASDDMIGVETGGALKNVLALAVGTARGLGLGASAEAALIARGFAELNRIAIEFGARPETMAGLSGLGDLVLSCSSPQSRNFAYGIALARGDNLDDLPLAEGVLTADVALQLANKHNVDAPITDMVVQVLQGKVTAKDAVTLLLSRPLKGES